jgi:hypothetical protein
MGRIRNAIDRYREWRYWHPPGGIEVYPDDDNVGPITQYASDEEAAEDMKSLGRTAALMSVVSRRFPGADDDQLFQHFLEDASAIRQQFPDDSEDQFFAHFCEAFDSAPTRGGLGGAVSGLSI